MSITLQEITHKSLLGMGGKIIRLLLNFITSIVLGRLYGAQIMGIYFLFISVVTLLAVPVKLGMHQSILKMASLVEMRENQERIGAFLQFANSSSLLLWLLMTAVLVVFQKPLTHNLFHLKIASGFWISTISLAVLVMVIFEHHRGLFLALRKVREVVLAEFIVQPLTICLLFILLAGFAKTAIWIVPAVYIFASGLGLFYLSGKQKALLPGPRQPLPWDKRKSFLKLSIPFCLTGIVYLIMYWSDSLFISYFHNAAEVGIYNAASRVAAFLPFLMVSFDLILPTTIVRMYHDGKTHEMFAMIRKISKWNLLFSLSIYSAFIVFPFEIIGFFGKEFIPAAFPLLLLGGAQVFNVAAGPNTTVLMMTGYEQQVFKASVITGFTNILLDLILIPWIGINGAAVATGASLILHNLLLYWLCRQHLGNSLHAHKLAKLIASFIGLSLILAWGYRETSLLVIIFTYIFSTFFLVWIWLSKDDLKLLQQILMKMSQKSG